MYVTHLGEGGLAKKITKCGIGGKGLIQRVMSLPQENIVSKIVFQLINVFNFDHSIDILM